MARRVAEFEVLAVVTANQPAVLKGWTPAALAGRPAGPGLRTVFLPR